MNIPGIDDVPRLDLRGFISPVQLLERFSDAVGVEVWCKRDDIGSVGLAGNKVRKLEYALAHALAEGAEHLVTEGSRLSNSARAVAAAAAALGLRCTLVLTHDEPRSPVGNLMLDGLFGAELRFVGDVSWEELERQTTSVVDELRESGEHVYRLPIGCASQRSCIGFVRAYGELRTQMEAVGADFRTIIHASSSGGTHAGLSLGRKIEGAAVDVHGIVVAENVYPDVAASYLSYANGAAEILGVEHRLTEDDVHIDQRFIGEGYGLPADGVMEAIDLLATSEGIIVDPVYSGKAVAALIRLARGGELRGPVVFWHTGGFHSLFDPHYAVQSWSEISRLSSIRL